MKTMYWAIYETTTSFTIESLGDDRSELQRTWPLCKIVSTSEMNVRYGITFAQAARALDSALRRRRWELEIEPWYQLWQDIPDDQPFNIFMKMWCGEHIEVAKPASDD